MRESKGSRQSTGHSGVIMSGQHLSTWVGIGISLRFRSRTESSFDLAHSCGQCFRVAGTEHSSWWCTERWERNELVGVNTPQDNPLRVFLLDKPRGVTVSFISAKRHGHSPVSCSYSRVMAGICRAQHSRNLLHRVGDFMDG